MNPGERIYDKLGSPLYMAPEILFQQPYDNRCDIYSLGCFLYNLLYYSYPIFESDLNKLL
jgi:serine/threonine protein kinase